MPGDRVNVVKVIDGKQVVQTVPVEKLAVARDAGWEQATDDETQRYKFVREATDTPYEKFEAGFEGFSSAVTLGLSDKAYAAVMDDEERQRMAARAESDARSTGEMLGVGATALSAGGVIKALGKRALAAEGSAALANTGRATLAADAALSYSPAGMVMRGAARVGEAVEARVLGEGTAGIARRAIARGAGLGTEGALEGAAYGVGQEISESALGDTELTAQKLLAGAGRGALYGGLGGAAIGVPLGAGSGVLARVLRRNADDVVVPTAEPSGTTGHVAPEIAESLGDKSIDLFSRVSSKLSGKEADDIAFGLKDVKAQTDFMRLKDLKTEAVQRTTGTLQKMKKLESFERRLAAGDFKAENVAKYIKRGDGEFERQVFKSTRLVDEVESQIRRNDINRLVGAANKKELEFITDAARRDLKAAQKAADPSTATYLAMEEFKRGLGDIRKRSADALTASRTSPMSPRVARQTEQLRNFTDVFGSKARQFLESAEDWGQAGLNQAERNKALTEVLNTKGDFDGRFFRKLKETEGGRRVEVADPNKIDTYYNQLTDYRKDYAHQQTMRHVQNRANLYDVLEKNGEIPADLLGEFQEAKKLLGEVRKDFADMGERIANANRIRDLTDQDAFQRMTGGNTGALVGTIMGGPAGTAIGFAVDALRNPGALVQKVAAIRTMAQRVGMVDQKIQKSVRAFVKQETAPELRTKPRRESRVKLRGKGLGAAFLLGSDAKSQAREVNKRVELVRSYQSDPIPVTDAFTRRTMRGVSDYAPGVAMSIAKTHARAMEFLAAKLPPIPRSKLQTLQPNLQHHALAPSQIEKLARYMNAIDEPVAIVEDMRTGRLTTEAVEAIRAVYPDLWADMRTVAVTTVAQTREPLSHHAVVRLSLLFDFVGTPTLAPEFQSVHNMVLANRAQTEQAAAPPPSARKAPDPVPATQTLSQRLTMSM